MIGVIHSDKLHGKIPRQARDDSVFRIAHSKRPAVDRRALLFTDTNIQLNALIIQSLAVILVMVCAEILRIVSLKRSTTLLRV